jgi:hypothetical protein
MKSVQLSALSVSLCMLAAAPSSAAPMTRCGWVVNPTPGNWWLTDRDGEWIIMTQGANNEAEGMDFIGDISAGEYKATNGNYGYSCGCMKVDVDARDKRITKIYEFHPSRLSVCKADKKLPKPE